MAANPAWPVDLHAAGFEEVRAWFAGQGGSERDARLSGVRLFDEHTAPGEAFALRAERAVSVWLLIDPAYSRRVERLYGGGLGGAIAFEQVRGGSPVVELPPLLGDVREEFTVPAGTARAYLLEAGETAEQRRIDA